MWFGVLKEYLMCIRAVWGPVIIPVSACREPSTGPLTEGEDVSNHQREEARVGNHSTTAAVLVTVAMPSPPLTPIRPRLHIPHCPGGLLR